MRLFTGQAWFSPRVPTAAVKAWISHGGSVAHTKVSGTQPTYLFCDGNDDPWFRELFQRSMAIFHWLWIPAVVNAQFRVSISAYAIDENTSADHNQRAAPAYMQNISRHVDPESTPCVRRTLVNADHNPHASPADTIGNDLHITLSAPAMTNTPKDMKHPTPGSSRRKPKSIPFVDLRIVCESQRSSYSKRSKARSNRIKLYAIPELPSKVDPPRQDSDLPRRFNAAVSTATSESSSRHILVSAALESLSYVAIDSATQFIPGTVHQGKEFRCFFMR
ncbi:hypothetical protein BC628DRAFT_1381663 [Trametes gibbosa]|nr:hypothetical protein BC628DRAFT_1381663 [Trametes gibbosa]